MMNRKRAQQLGRIKYLMFLPLTALLMVISNTEAVARTTKSMAKEATQATERTVNQDSTIVTNGQQTSPQDKKGKKKADVESSEMPQTVTIPECESVEESTDEIYMMVEQAPEYPGGVEAMFEYIKQSIKYPADARKSETQGRVAIQVVIDAEGKVTYPIVRSSISPSLDAEALRIISSMPQWSPGKQRGKAVRVQYTIPVLFLLTED